jgi:hypothetical protein
MMAAPHRRQGFPRWGWPALLALLVLVVTGCSGVPSNTPEAYDDTLPGGTVIVESNFMEGCTAGEDGFSPSECECVYDGITAEDGIPFEEFKELDGALEDEPEAYPAAYEDILERCPRGEVVGPTADDATTTTEDAS